MNTNRAWHEEDHPRDREGKFTFKNGGDYSLGDETDYISLLLNLLKSNFLSDKYKTQIINNINKHTISSDNNNSNNNIKLETYNLKSSNKRNNNKPTRENNTNPIDKINNLVKCFSLERLCALKKHERALLCEGVLAMR